MYIFNVSAMVIFVISAIKMYFIIIIIIIIIIY